MRSLEAGPVNLVTGRFRREPAVCAFGGSAMIDNPVDLTSNRHGNAIRIGESHHYADGFDSLSDLIHRRDDFVDRLACTELLANMPVAAALAGACDDEIAHTGQPGEGVAVTTRRLAELGHLAHRTGHHHGAGVFANAHRVAHTYSDRVDILQRARHLDANHIVGGVSPKSLGANNPARFAARFWSDIANTA